MTKRPEEPPLDIELPETYAKKAAHIIRLLDAERDAHEFRRTVTTLRIAEVVRRLADRHAKGDDAA